MRIIPRVALTVALLAIAAVCGSVVFASYEQPGFSAVHLGCLIVAAACAVAVVVIWPARGAPRQLHESQIADVRRVLRGMRPRVEAEDDRPAGARSRRALGADLIRRMRHAIGLARQGDR